VATQADLRKIGEGREAEIFAYGEGRILRLLRDPRDLAVLEHEAAAMRAAADAGVPVPRVHEIIEFDGRPAIVMERVDGADLLSMVASRPWTVFAAGRITGELHARLNLIEAPAGLPVLRERMRRSIDVVIAAGLPARLGEMALHTLDALPDGDRICHGDFHPGNIIGERSHAIIDWPNVTRGDPDADYARTFMMMRLGDLPPGSPALLRVAATFARGLLLSSYRRAYNRVRRPDAGAIERWLVVCAAVRLSEGIEPERAKLLALLERAAAAR
jgi:aminoglycoside phosphotransferase (APT) family kinase protein